MALEFDDLSHRVIGAGITVHKTLGPGFLEAVYEEAFCLELTALQIPFERQKAVRILYSGRVVGDHRLDVFVAECLVFGCVNWRTNLRNQTRSNGSRNLNY